MSEKLDWSLIRRVMAGVTMEKGDQEVIDRVRAKTAEIYRRSGLKFEICNTSAFVEWLEEYMQPFLKEST